MESMSTPSTPKKIKVEDEFIKLSSICASNNANIHGVIVKLSPMKKGKQSSYFEGTLSDGTTEVRLYGFNEVKHEQLKKFKVSGEAVKLMNCQIKGKRGDSDKLEVCVNDTAEVDESGESFNVEVNDKVPLSSVSSLEDYTSVTVSALVNNVELPTEVSKGLTKQDVYISDGDTSMKLSLWEQDVGMLNEGMTYILRDLTVRSFRDVKYLSFSKGASATEITSVVSNEADASLDKCEVIGVVDFDFHYACLSCGHHFITSEDFGNCEKCGMIQRVEFCKACLSAKLLIKSVEEQHSFVACGRILCEIAKKSEMCEVNEKEILSAGRDQFSITYKNKSITSVHRNDS